MNFDYFDNAIAPVTAEQKQQQQLELQQLADIADKIGSYYWSYKEDFANKVGTDTDEHIGPIAQQLLGIPGLSSAVIQNEDGTLAIDTQYLSLATFSMLAALARFIGVNNYGRESQLSAELSDTTTIPSAGSSEATSEAAEATANGAATSGTEESNREVVQPDLEADKADNIADVDSTGSDTAVVEA